MPNLDLETYVSTHPGLEQSQPCTHRLRIASSEGFFGMMPANDYAWCGGNVLPMSRYNGFGYNTADVTQTLASGSIAQSTNGLLVTTAVSTTAVVSRSNQTLTPAAGYFYKKIVEVQLATAATTGFMMGVMQVTTTPFTAPNNGAWITSPNNSAALTAAVRGNGGTQADITSFITSSAGASGAVSQVDATNMKIGIEFFIGASAALSWGGWWVNGFRTAMPTAQLTQLFAMVAGAQPLCSLISVQGDGSARTGIFKFDLGYADKG